MMIPSLFQTKQLCMHTLLIMMFMLASMVLHVTAHAAEMYSEQPLFAEPSVHAEQVGIAKLGEVELLGQRQGFWIMIKTADHIEGWIKVSHVKIEETEAWMDPIDSLRDTGRLAVSKKQEVTEDER